MNETTNSVMSNLARIINFGTTSVRKKFGVKEEEYLKSGKCVIVKFLDGVLIKQFTDEKKLKVKFVLGEPLVLDVDLPKPTDEDYMERFNLICEYRDVDCRFDDDDPDADIVDLFEDKEEHITVCNNGILYTQKVNNALETTSIFDHVFKLDICSGMLE